MREEVLQAVKGFAMHGVVFRKESDDQVIGDCPFTGKVEKFFVNWKTRQWDSKTAGLSGNFGQFLEAVAKENLQLFQKSPEAQARLSADRRLPRSAFQHFGIGWNGDTYTLPIRYHTGRSFTDLRLFRPGKKLVSTSGAQAGLFGCDQLLDPKRVGEPVYLCEGEWDAVALNWLLRKLGEKGICVAVPGAGVFKAEWVPLFKGRTVFVLYDADDAGIKGEFRAWQFLRGTPKQLRFVRWSPNAPEGFDVRDWIVYGCMKLGTPRACLAALKEKLVGEVPRQEEKGKQAAVEAEKGAKAPKLPPLSASGLYSEFKRWLHLQKDDVLAVVFGTVLANRLDGDPLWLFLVAPPGGMKSEVLMSLAEAEGVLACSSLTPHALVSGASWVGGEDPSMIPKLNGKVLVVKDFTTTLSMHPMARDEIFGQLRDCYDGKFEKQFGNGIFRKYESRFGILAGVTPNIDAFSSLHSGLGERFLKFRLETELAASEEEERILRAISNINQESSMRSKLQEAAARFLGTPRSGLPNLPPEVQKKLVRLAMLTARLRGVVHRDKYNSGLVVSKATHEIGTRLGKQLSKLALGVSLYYGESKVSDRAYRLAARVALASAPDKIEEIVSAFWKLRKKGQAFSTKTVFEASTKLTLSTVYRTLQDLAMLGVVKQVILSSGKFEWSLSGEILKLLEEGEVYGT